MPQPDRARQAGDIRNAGRRAWAVLATDSIAGGLCGHRRLAVQPGLDDPRPYHPEFLRYGSGDVEHPPEHKRSAIVHATVGNYTIAGRRDEQFSAEGERAVGTGGRSRVIRLTTRGGPPGQGVAVKGDLPLLEHLAERGRGGLPRASRFRWRGRYRWRPRRRHRRRRSPSLGWWRQCQQSWGLPRFRRTGRESLGGPCWRPRPRGRARSEQHHRPDGGRDEPSRCGATQDGSGAISGSSRRNAGDARSRAAASVEGCHFAGVAPETGGGKDTVANAEFLAFEAVACGTARPAPKEATGPSHRAPRSGETP